MIDWGIVAPAVRIAAIVVWIGGVWLVTTVLLPRMKQKPAEEWIREFDAIERRFAPQAWTAVLLVVLSGFYMLYAYDLWDRFQHVEYWWMHLMAAVWLLFAALLFVISRSRRTMRSIGVPPPTPMPHWPESSGSIARCCCRRWPRSSPLSAAATTYFDVLRPGSPAHLLVIATLPT